VNPEEEKGRAAVGRICRKGRFKVLSLERKSEWVMEYQILVSMTSVCLFVTMCRCSIETSGRIELAFGTEVSFSLSYTTY